MAHSEWQEHWKDWVHHSGPQGDWIRSSVLDTIVLRLLGDVSDTRVLDAGCGDGRFCRVLAQKSARVIGLDIVPEFIQLASEIQTGTLREEWKQEFPWADEASKIPALFPVEYRIGELTEPLPDLVGRMDSVVCYLTLNDVQNLNAACQTLCGTLRRGGKFITVLPHPRHLAPRMTPLVEGAPYRETIALGFEITNYYRSTKHFLRTLATSGLTQHEIQPVLLSVTVARKHRSMIDAIRSARGLPDPTALPWFFTASHRKV